MRKNEEAIAQLEMLGHDSDQWTMRSSETIRKNIRAGLANAIDLVKATDEIRQAEQDICRLTEVIISTAQPNRRQAVSDLQDKIAAMIKLLECAEPSDKARNLGLG